MRKTPFDEFIYYDPKEDRIIRRCRDMKIDGQWEYFHNDGIGDTWWDTTVEPPRHWELLDRFPEFYFTPIKKDVI